MNIVQTTASDGITGSGTAGTIPLLATTTSLGNSIITQVGTSSIIITSAAAPATGANIFAVTGTMPNTTATENGIVFTVTSAGTGGTKAGMQMIMNAGFTGNASCSCLRVFNQAAGTAAGSLAVGATGNFAINANMTSTTTGTNCGGQAQAVGSSGLNVGYRSSAISASNSPALNVGYAGFAINATINVAGFFGLMSGAPTLGASCALIADNSSQTSDIFQCRDNGSVVFTVADGGTITATGTVLAALFQTTTALVALGGGAAATLGTIGGSGPTTAAQNSWLPMKSAGGVAGWVPWYT